VSDVTGHGAGIAERYFWSLLAAVAIFISGAMFSFYIGIHTIVSS
jgi:hypothetical protein